MTRKREQNKHKIINDPVFGFILVPYNLLLTLIEHPYVQRLKRIKQLGLSHYVYPGAQHTRFQHILGAMHLMSEAVKTLRDKGVEISAKEEKAVLSAILLHDIGHGPFSHALEHTIVPVHHEEISILAMQYLNKELHGKLDLAIEIFTGTYHKKFLHQLVSSQLDMDRMDYLRRDSFFTGVIEGTIGSARIIKMLNVHDDHLVLDAKGIYSIEKFLIARRLMYWQVYLHKTAVAAEHMLINVLKRAKELSQQGGNLFATPPLSIFLNQAISKETFLEDKNLFRQFMQLDDSDFMVSFKSWQNHPDVILSKLSQGLVHRKLYKTEIHSHPIEYEVLESHKNRLCTELNIKPEESHYLVFETQISAQLQTPDEDKVNILFKNGKVESLEKASDIFNSTSIENSGNKHLLCYLRT